MRAFSRSIAVVAVLVLSFSGSAAQAACNKSDDEIVKSAELARLLDQVDLGDPAVSARQAEARGMTREEYEGLSYAAKAGFVLSQQFRYLGDSKARRAMFDCVHDFIEKATAVRAMRYGFSPVDPLAAFKGAILGGLEDEELVALGVDPSQTVKSIFADGAERWIGKWELVSTTPYVHKPDGSPFPVKNRIQVWRDENEEVWVGFLAKGAAPPVHPVHPQFTDTDMTMKTKSVRNSPIDFRLTQDGSGCTGVMHSVTPKGKKLTWKTTCRPL